MFKYECPKCGGLEWTPNKTTKHMDDDGSYYTLRYRICKDCKYKIRTKQYEGYNEIPITEQLRTYKKRSLVTTYDSATGEKLNQESWSLEDSLKVLNEVYGEKEKPKLKFKLYLKGE